MNFLRPATLGCTAVFLASASATASEACATLDPHLVAIEAGYGEKSNSPLALNLGETECTYKSGTKSEFEHAFECIWKNTETKIWTTDDAKDIGSQLHQQCWQLTAHFGGDRSEQHDYFLWFGDFTAVTVNHTTTGIELVVKIDEEAFYFS